MPIEDHSYLYTKQVTAAVFRINVSSLNKWIENGCPVQGKKGNRYMLDLRDVIQWRTAKLQGNVGGDTDDEVSYQASRARRERARAEEAEIQLALLKGDIASVSEVMAKWQQVAVALRTKLLSLPTKLAAKLGAAKTISRRQEIIETGITGALNDLVEKCPGAEPDKPTGTSVLGKDATARKTTNKRVGRRKKSVKSGK